MATTTKQTVYAHHNVLRELQQIPEDEQDALINKCKDASLLTHPAEHSAIKNVGGAEFYRVRAGSSRAIIDYYQAKVRILLVGHRDGFYSDRNLAKAENRSYQQ